MSNRTTFASLAVGALIGAMPVAALFVGLSIISVEVQDFSCDSPSIGFVSIMEVAISPALLAIGSEVCIPSHLRDLYENLGFIYYAAIALTAVHMLGAALFLMNGQPRFVGAGLLGALLGEISIFIALSPVFNKHCHYWLMGCSGDVAALFGGLLLMVSGGAVGVLAWFLVAHSEETSQRNTALGFAEIVKQRWNKLWAVGIAKGALIGTAPGLFFATLLFAWGLFVMLSEPYASFYGETVFSCAMFLLSVASLGGASRRNHRLAPKKTTA